MMLKKKIMFILLTLILVVPAGAYAYTFSGNKFQHPTNMDYYIGDSVRDKGFWPDANHGGKAWNGAAEIEAYEGFSKIYAEIRFEYSSTDKGDIPASEVSECRCVYSDYSNITLWKGFGGLTDTKQKETTAHEVGHSLGLGHEDDVQSIMLSEGFNNYIYPYADDWKGIAARY